MTNGFPLDDTSMVTLSSIKKVVDIEQDPIEYQKEISKLQLQESDMWSWLTENISDDIDWAAKSSPSMFLSHPQIAITLHSMLFKQFMRGYLVANERWRELSTSSMGEDTDYEPDITDFI
jgi:hypothetical protein